MFSLPERTLYNRKIAKSKFYEKLKANTKLKDMFVDEVDNIIWKHKLSKETINLDPTDDVQEIQIFEIYLKQRELSRQVLENIDKAVPYPILYVLVYKNEARLVIAYKQRNRNDENRFVINGYYESNWEPIDRVPKNLINGLNLQAVYENIVRSLMCTSNDNNDDLETAVERQNEIEKLKRECIKLEAKIRNEKQFDRKVDLNLELQKKKKELNKFTECSEEEYNG